MKTYTPVYPITVKGNQYGFPGKTYYYVVDATGKIYHHSDKVWRKKYLIQLWSYGFRSLDEVKNHFNEHVMNGKPRGILTIPENLNN